jgi:hypothetical protein
MKTSGQGTGNVPVIEAPQQAQRARQSPAAVRRLEHRARRSPMRLTSVSRFMTASLAMTKRAAIRWSRRRNSHRRSSRGATAAMRSRAQHLPRAVRMTMPMSPCRCPCRHPATKDRCPAVRTSRRRLWEL